MELYLSHWFLKDFHNELTMIHRALTTSASCDKDLISSSIDGSFRVNYEDERIEKVLSK